uniref:DekiORF30 n=1 Tax=Dendrolimus kikuchii nucleopolyhedrovirus TaxID=1219875 RepID=V9LSU1_9ABAC|nr:DekiORF30 [Dendrolimus kikuchii nucleopolyhedrovirus]
MSLVNRKCSFGDVVCDLWIVDMENDKFMYGGHAIAKFLGYKNIQKAIRDHVKPQWKTTWEEIKNVATDIQLPSNWQPNTVFISEAGVYALICKSKLPAADIFREWLFEEVIPQMRRAGTLSKSFNDFNAQRRASGEFDRDTQYVYLITSPEYKAQNIYKIGTTRSPEARVCQLNCGRPFDLLKLDYCEAAENKGYAVEALMLKEYKSRLLHGEWVQFADNDQYLAAKHKMVEFIQFCCDADAPPLRGSTTVIQDILSIVQ